MYLLLMKGPGDGCDYTIGCNRTWKFIDTDDEAEARARVMKIINYYGGDDRVAKATLIRVGDRKRVNLDVIYTRQREAARKRKAEAELLKKRETLKRLKAELGE